ncbi:glycoside hydrolase family 25 protein [Runella sp.]|uniref:glycoside hydrolase family 25 protein n=1 Tax=Runella sp. TaxID=1960881 RepID=UPI003D09D235
MKYLLLIFCFVLTLSLRAQSAFDRPWIDSTKAFILDPYSGNVIDFNKIISNPRMTGIIHRASDGLKRDTGFAGRKIQATKKNLLWGSYHLGRPGDPIQQADFYLSAINQDSVNVMALDLEDVEDSKFMNMDNAIKFIEHIKQKTGKYPLVYANQKVVKAISLKFNKNSVFAKCPLWYARFKNKVTDFPKNVWSTYTVWQFACEINCCECIDVECTKHKLNYISKCPYNKGKSTKIEGIKCDMDVNIYNGTVKNLRQNWNVLGKQ